MTVKELVENLQNFPPESQVLLAQDPKWPFVGVGAVCNVIVGEEGFVTLHSTMQGKYFSKVARV